MSARDEQSMWFPATLATLLVIAAALRLHLTSSLYEDETWVAQLVRHGGLRPHTFAVPPLFYWIERAWTSLRGATIAALREPPAFFGVVLAALPFAATRLDRTTRFTWSVLLAFSSPLLFYSARMKQYTLEACVSTLLIILWINAEESESRAPRLLFFMVAVIGVMTLHTPLLICLAALVAALFSSRARHIPTFTGFAVVGVAFAVAWLGWLKPGPESTRLHGDMTAWFAATGRWVTSPHLFVDDTKHWLGQAFNLVPFWWAAVALLVVVMLISSLVDGRRKVIVLAFALIPPLAAALLSTRQIYPYGEVRLMIFAFPALYLLVATSFSVVSRHMPWLLLVLAPFVIGGAAYDVYNRTYMGVDDLTPMYDAVAASHRPGEPVWAAPGFAAPLVFHHPELAPDVREGMAPGPGWHLGRDLAVPNADVVLRIGHNVAARVSFAPADDRSAAAPAR